MAPSATLAQLVPPGSVYAPMRITGPAKMTHLIQFALKHFQVRLPYPPGRADSSPDLRKRVCAAALAPRPDPP